MIAPAIEWAPPPPKPWEPGREEDGAGLVVNPFPWPDHYPPLSVAENLRWRLRTTDACKRSPKKARAIKELCRRDIRFWLAGFCWLSEPRASGMGSTTIPFVPYDYQLHMTLDMEKSIDEQSDLALAKSRDMGVTWLCLLVIQHKWLFTKGFAAMLGSLTEDLVDQRGNINTLFEKLRFNLKRQPPFLLPKGFKPKHDKYMLMTNPELGSDIEGSSTNGEIARSGRYKVIMLDEHATIHPNQQLQIEASTSDAASSRWYVSTPRGNQNTFYRKCHSGHVQRIDAHWSEHPFKGMRCWQEIEFKNGKCLAGKVRSPWYDHEVASRDQPEWLIAQELDISFAGSGETLVDSRILSLWRNGALDALEERYKGHRTDGQAALLIFEKPVPGRGYILGCDPSGGSKHGSWAAIQIFTSDTLRQVAEYQGRIGVDVLSTLVYTLGREYNQAYLCVEENAGAAVLNDLVYGHLDRHGIFKEVDAKIKPYPAKHIALNAHVDGKITDKYGIQTTGVSKHFMVYSLLEPYVRNQEILVSGTRTINELSGFHDSGTKLHNPDGDDLVMAMLMILYGHRFRPKQGRGTPAPFIAR